MRSALTAAALMGAMSAVQASPVSVSKRDVITALPASASTLENKFQPLLDFDTDGCYNTAAISPDGTINPGLAATSSPSGGCRDAARLQNSNVYSRSRCNNGICAVMYEYYFEKDQAVGGSFLGGHRHDWENIVVFTQGDTIIRVAPSCHGDYDNASNSFPTSGTNAQLVYHKDGIGTHCFRFASADDIANPENFSGQMYKSPLVGWDGYPSGLRDAMLNAWSGGVGPKLDSEFTDKLTSAAGDGVPGFDPSLDA